MLLFDKERNFFHFYIDTISTILHR